MLRPIRIRKKGNALEEKNRRTKRYVLSQRIVIRSPLAIGMFLMCTLCLVFDRNNWITENLAASNGLDVFSPRFYLRLLLHPLAHADFSHYFANMTLLMVLTPFLEDACGWKNLLKMICITAAVEGTVNAAVSNYYLVGASGVVFMMTLLTPIVANVDETKETEIPLTFIIVAIMWIGREIDDMNNRDGISHTCHIVGGLCGAYFGLRSRKRTKRSFWSRLFFRY